MGDKVRIKTLEELKDLGYVPNSDGDIARYGDDICNGGILEEELIYCGQIGTVVDYNTFYYEEVYDVKMEDRTYIPSMPLDFLELIK